MSEAPSLVLRGFGIAFGGTPVLADLDLELPARGVVVLVGPSGTGKSTLLRTLAGLNDAHPSMSTWGTAELDGRPLFPGPDAAAPKRGVGIVLQHSRFFMNTVRENLVSALPNRSRLERSAQTEIARALLRDSGLPSLVDRLDDEAVTLPQAVQRQLAIVRATAGDPGVLLADEPTAGLDDDAAVDVIELLRGQAAARAVLLVTHNRRHAVAAGGATVFLAGGRVVEQTPTATFFREPRTEAGKQFLATGHCALPSPGAREADLDDESPRPPPLSAAAIEAVERGYVGPRGFFWVLPRRLGGLPRPGIVAALEHDLEGLRRLGVTVLVTLEEATTVDAARLGDVGVRSIHFPVADMGAPAIGATSELCASLEVLMQRGEVVAFHCRAGLGRTGTLLASQLVWEGEPALRAIERVRLINPRCIQSSEQVEFLRAFERAVRGASKVPSCFPETTEPRRKPNVA